MAVLSLATTTPYTITYTISDMTSEYVDTAIIELYEHGVAEPIKTATHRKIDTAHLTKLFGYFTGLKPNTHYRVHSKVFRGDGQQTSEREDSIETGSVFKGTPNSVVHSLNISTKSDVYNTFENWGLVPAERPSVVPPELKTEYVDLPASDGQLDYTELLVGKTPYGRRSGSWRFYTDEIKMASLGLTWSVLYNRIQELIHGVECEISFDDDSDYYYTGRLSVNRWRSSKAFSEITIDYNLESYKFSRTKSSDVDWQWDVAIENVDFTILYGTYASQEYKVLNFINTGGQPVVPEMDASTDMKIKTDFGDLVAQVILGEWGYGQDRYDRLEAAGYCWQAVQNAVNEALGSNYRYEIPPDAMTPKTEEAIENGELDTGTEYNLIEGKNINSNLALNPGDNPVVIEGNGNLYTEYPLTEL